MPQKSQQLEEWEPTGRFSFSFRMIFRFYVNLYGSKLVLLICLLQFCIPPQWSWQLDRLYSNNRTNIPSFQMHSSKTTSLGMASLEKEINDSTSTVSPPMKPCISFTLFPTKQRLLQHPSTSKRKQDIPVARLPKIGAIR